MHRMLSTGWRLWLVGMLGWGWGWAATAQNVVPNPRFDRANGRQPEAWTLADGEGGWGAVDGGTGPVLWLRGRGEDASTWQGVPLALEGRGWYRLKVVARRRERAEGGTALAGVGAVHRDFPLGTAWETNVWIFTAREGDLAPMARLGQWHVRGAVEFREMEVLPVQAVHGRFAGGLELGEGESVRAGVYRAEAALGGRGGNAWRPVVRNGVGFNSNRWLFEPGAELVLRHALAGMEFVTGSLRVGVNHHSGGTLAVEVGSDGKTWRPVGQLDGARRSGEWGLPTELFPAGSVYVRLVCRGNGGLQVDTYGFEGRPRAEVPDAEGWTRYLAVEVTDPALKVTLVGREDAEGAAPGGLRLRAKFGPRTPPKEDASWRMTARVANEISGESAAAVVLEARPGEERELRVPVPRTTAGEQRFRVEFRDAERTVFVGRWEERVGFLEAEDFGTWLGSTPELTWWWCESGWKVGRRRSAPRPAEPAERSGPESAAARVALARGEREAVQIVLRPERPLEIRDVRWESATTGDGPLRAELNEVAYVPVTRPTDETCVRGAYPDPLPPLQFPLSLRAGENQPIWVTLFAPPEAMAGRSTGRLVIRTSQGEVVVPITAEVYDFELPRDTHLRSAFGLGMGSIARYHRLDRREDRVAVFEKYLRNFAEHRISPYSFFDHAPIDVRFEGEGAAKRARVDFAAFDRAAERWLDEGRFNTFQLPLRGMGGGTFHDRHLGRLEGFEEGTPEHARLFGEYLGQVEAHLRERGWLKQAFTYWFDEPDPKDYDFVVAGMKRLKEAAPGIRRMLTEQPEPALLGHVDIWCGLTPEWTRERVQERRAAGEEVWWYICTGPKAPYVTEFIDHPGTELRLWPWQSWQYGVSGLLVWASVYWTSPLAYPEPEVQDPWQDPMSWVSGYGMPVGHRGPWGNGDGRFLYPPRRDPNRSMDPSLDGPVSSLRWESLRDGMEDYEYLWLLQEEVRRGDATGTSAEKRREALAVARRLLAVPAEVSTDLRRFTNDPRVILGHRERVARAIERLRHGE